MTLLASKMTEPVNYSYGGTAPIDAGHGQSTEPIYEASDQSTAPGPVVSSQTLSGETIESDPELIWLASDEATQYQNHWVALDPATGSFLGLADSLHELRLWQARNATIIFVDPPPENWMEG